MVIKYDNIEFDNVDDLIEYKNKINKPIKTTQTIEPIKYPKIKKGFSSRRWSNDETKELFEILSNPKIKTIRKKIKAFAHKQNRTIHAINCRIWVLKNKNKLPKQINHNYMTKQKPNNPIPYEVRMKAIANKALNDTGETELLFSKFTTEANTLMKQILVNMHNSGGRITYNDCITYFQLKDGITWGQEIYADFLEEFLTKRKTIEKILNINLNNFKIEKVGNRMAIVHNKMVMLHD